MPSRAKDWIDQAVLDLEHARHSLAAGDHNWACFATQQAAEKAIKAIYQAKNMIGWGHVLTALLGELQDEIAVPDPLLDLARKLDQYYVATRYPNGFERGKPADFYTADQAAEAIAHAQELIEFCQDQIGTTG